MFIDYVHKGVGYGVGAQLQEVSFDPGMLRPYFDKYDRPSVTINTGRWTTVKGERKPIREHRLIRDLANNGIMSPVFNATSLRKEEWLELDRVVIRAARFRLRAWADLASANSFGGFNAMGKMILEHETMSDPGEAIVDMDGVTEGRGDSPQFQLEGLPLPITHSDFRFSARRLAISRNSGTPLDTAMGEASGRRVAESVEKVTIGVDTGITYGGASTQQGGYGRTPSVYGYLNFPQRLLKTNVTLPTSNSWTPGDTVADVLAMRDSLYTNKFYGPFMLYHSNDWDQYLDSDYIVAAGVGNVSGVTTRTLRQRLRDIESITDVRRLDFLTASATSSTDPARVTASNPFTLIMVQMTSDVCRAVNGMDITTVQWEEKGGMDLRFKVMTIAVPQLRADFYGKAGILVGTTS